MGIRSSHHDVVVVGAGHNGLVAAILLARRGLDVVMLERLDDVGGAAISANVFPGTGVRLSRFSYLVSLFPDWLLAQLGAEVELRHRAVSSYTPVGDTGILDRDGLGLAALKGLPALYPTLTEPLRSAADVRELLGPDAFSAIAERPLSELIEATYADDVTRGIIATDALIGTFAPLDDPDLRQNRCFLYHVVGGAWNVPVGGMGALTRSLKRTAAAAGVNILTATTVSSIDADAESGGCLVRMRGGDYLRSAHVLANVAPAQLSRLLGDRVAPESMPEGSQLKLNMLLTRLPRLKDSRVNPRDAFAGTFHINESYSQLNAAYAAAANGQIPDPVPCEAYCHSLSDPSILPPDLQRSGAVSLTVFALHMPARLFRGPGADGTPIDHDAVKRAAVSATLDSINAVLDEPLEDCLMSDPRTGQPCIEAHTPIEIEAELGMPAGHIFHRDLSWPWAESPDDIDRWGVETARPNVLICGSGARRGGAVSGIPGHNAAMALLEKLERGPASV